MFPVSLHPSLDFSEVQKVVPSKNKADVHYNSTSVDALQYVNKEHSSAKTLPQFVEPLGVRDCGKRTEFGILIGLR